MNRIKLLLLLCAATSGATYAAPKALTMKERLTKAIRIMPDPAAQGTADCKAARDTAAAEAKNATGKNWAIGQTWNYQYPNTPDVAVGFLSSHWDEFVTPMSSESFKVLKELDYQDDAPSSNTGMVTWSLSPKEMLSAKVYLVPVGKDGNPESHICLTALSLK